MILLSPRENKLRAIAEIAGWNYGGSIPHARGHQLRLWRGSVGALDEARVARTEFAQWTARQVRRIKP